MRIAHGHPSDATRPLPRVQLARQIRVRHIGLDAALGHLPQILIREKSAVGQHPLRTLRALSLHFFQQRQQRLIVRLVLRHPLRHDEMVLAHRNLRRITQHEAPPLPQKTGVWIGGRQLFLAALPQILQLLAQPRDLLRPHTRSRITIGIVVQLLLPALHLLAQLPLPPFPAPQPIGRGPPPRPPPPPPPPPAPPPHAAKTTAPR